MIDNQQVEEHAANAEIRTKRSFSVIWIVPLVALLIGGWLAFKAISEKGPTITITFVNAEGLEAGKTKISYRDVTIGQVEKITLSEDLSHVVVTAKLAKGSEPYMTDKTKFWVVRARVRGGSVSGISTILSGAYIGIDPIMTGNPTHTFTGLEVPPVVTYGQKGRHYTLTSDTLGSLDIGAPVYYRQIQVGQVVGYGFGPNGKGIKIQIFINDPYDKNVMENTRFWNASGIDVSLNADGLKVDTQSLVSIVTGGIAFDVPKFSPPGEQATNNALFRLYKDHTSIQEKEYAIRKYWMLIFNQSVRGLSIGAPVELYGIKVGEVADLGLEFDAATKQFDVPVLITIEPERVRVLHATDKLDMEGTSTETFLQELVEQRGLRAQLQSGNLLTGQMMVNLAFIPEAEKVVLTYRDKYPIVPTVPGSFEQIQENIAKLIKSLDEIPFQKIGNDLHLVLNEAKGTLDKFGKLSNRIDKETAPQVSATLSEIQTTLVELKRTIDNNSPLNYRARKALKEMSKTLKSFRELMDTLNNKPQALIFGKEQDTDE